jgi:hypothetical protein
MPNFVEHGAPFSGDTARRGAIFRRSQKISQKKKRRETLTTTALQHTAADDFPYEVTAREKKSFVSLRSPTKVLALPTGKERGETPNNMKYLALFALIAISMALGACASKPAPATSTSTSTKYSK